MTGAFSYSNTSDQALVSGNTYYDPSIYLGNHTLTMHYWLPVLQSFSGWYGDDYSQGLRSVQFASRSTSSPVLPGYPVFDHEINIQVNGADNFSTAPWAGGQTATGEYYHITGTSPDWVYSLVDFPMISTGASVQTHDTGLDPSQTMCMISGIGGDFEDTTKSAFASVVLVNGSKHWVLTISGVGMKATFNCIPFSQPG